MKCRECSATAIAKEMEAHFEGCSQMGDGMFSRPASDRNAARVWFRPAPATVKDLRTELRVMAAGLKQVAQRVQLFEIHLQRLDLPDDAPLVGAFEPSSKTRPLAAEGRKQ